MSVEVREIGSFEQVRFKGPGILKITQTDDMESLTVHAPAYVMADIESSVRNGTLHLGYISPKVVPLKVLKEVISYDLRVKQVNALSLSGSGRILVLDFDSDRLKLDLSGSGKIVMEHLTADQLAVKISGCGKISVEGDVEVQNIKISGSGTYDALRLVSDYCYISIPGSGAASVMVNEEMEINIDGSGQVNYTGYPEIHKRIAGSGKIKRVRKTLDRESQHPSGEDRG